MKKIKILTKLAFTVVFAAFIPSCAVNPVTGGRQLMLMSEAQEIKLGTEYDPTVVATFGLYENAGIEAFITQRGTEMGKISHRPNLQYRFRILDSPVINAFAVPGGYIYFTRGILAQFNNEAELIGVLGHEMGHITARHTASQQSKQQLGQLLLLGGMIASEELRQFADYATQGMQLLFLKYSRDNEREADNLGVEYSSKIGYDAKEMAEFFNVLNKMNMESEHAGVPTFLSTHPDPGDRYNSVLQQTNTWQQKLNVDNWAVNSDNYLSMIDGLVYGEDPRQGFVENGVFYHPILKFRYPIPAGWSFQNSPVQVQMASADGNAMIVFTLAEQRTVDEAAQTAVKELGLTTLESKKVTVNSLPATALVSQQVSQNQQTIKVFSYFIEYNGSVYTFHGVSTEENYNKYSSIFETTMGSFNQLTDASKLNVKPQRIKIQSVRNEGTLADAFNYYKVPQAKMAELALLNNMNLTDRVQAGKLIKVIGE